MLVGFHDIVDLAGCLVQIMKPNVRTQKVVTQRVPAANTYFGEFRDVIEQGFKVFNFAVSLDGFRVVDDDEKVVFYVIVGIIETISFYRQVSRSLVFRVVVGFIHVREFVCQRECDFLALP